MQLSKNKKYQYTFFLLISIYTIFNGGNSNLLIQVNFLLISFFYFFCLRDKNYNLENKQWVLVTIDPERDTPEDIDKYAKGFDDDFIGVSNERPMLLSLATQLSVNNVMPSMHNDMDHTHLDNHVNSIILLNPKGEYVGLFRPPFSTSRLSLTYQSVTQD